MWCSPWPRRYACATRFLPHLRCLLQAPTTPVAGAAEACRLRQDRAHTTRDEASEPALATKFAQQRTLQRPIREKTRPTQPLQRPIREKTRPAGTKKPKLGCFEPAGRTFSRTGHSHVATLKPTAPLQPLMQATVKPPSPLLAPEQQPLKPLAPLQPKNTPKTPISHPQRRRRFQLAHHTGPQRRHRFQTTAPRTATSPAGAEGVGGTVGYARASRRGAERSEVA